MVINKIILVLVLLILTASTVSAIEYTIKIGTELKTNIGWSAQKIDYLNTSKQTASPIPGGVSITLASTYYDNGQVWLKVTPLQSGSSDVLLKKSDVTCLKGDAGDNTIKCKTDPVNATEGTTRLTLLDIIETSTTTTTTASSCTNASSDIITTYVSTSSGSKYIKNNDIPTYDITSYSSTTGWTSSVADKSVNLYIKTNCINYDTEVSIDAGKGDYSGPYYESDNSIIRYTLKSNDKYLFTVKVKQKVGPWNSDDILKYGIILKGLAGSSSCNIIIPAPYEITLGNTKDLSLPDGEFTTLAGFTSNKLSSTNGKTDWKVGFSNPGTYTTVYTPISCSPIGIAFIVTQNNPTPTPATTIKQSQSITGNQGIFTDDLSKTGVIVVAFILVSAAIVLFLKNRKGRGGGKYRGGVNDESGAT